MNALSAALFSVVTVRDHYRVSSRFARSLLPRLAPGLSLLLLPLAQTARSQTWASAANGNWSTAANWTGGVAPANNGTAIVTFDPPTASTTVDAPWNLYRLAFTGTSAHIISGAALTLQGTANGSGLTFSSSGGVTHTINNAITLGAAQTWSGSGTNTLSLTGGVTNGGYLLTTATSSSGTTLTLSGALSGTGGLTVTGVGTTRLDAANTFSGVTTLSTATATLTLGHSLALQNSSLTFTAGTLSFGTLTSVTFGGLLGSRGFALTNASAQPVALTIDTTATPEVWQSGALTGNGSLTKTGSGTLSITGTNTYSGPTTVLAGTFQPYSLPNSTLDYRGGTVSFIASSTLGGLTGSGSLAMTSELEKTFTLTVGGNNANTTYDGILTGLDNPGINSTGTFIKTGTGALTFTNVHTFDGTTRISAGTIALTNSRALQDSKIELQGGTLTFGSLTAATVGGLRGSSALALTNTSLSPVALTFNVSSTQSLLNYSGELSGPGSVIKTGAGEQRFRAATSFTGTTTIAGGTLTAGHPLALQNTTVEIQASGTLGVFDTLAVTLGGLSGAGGFASFVDLSVGNNNASTTYSGVMTDSGSPGSLTKIGTGTLTLTNANLYSGATNVNAGTLALAHDNALGASVVTFNGGLLLAAGAARTLSNAAVFNVDPTFSGAFPLTLAGAATLNGSRLFNVTAAASLTLGGPVGESSSSTLTKQGNGTLRLEGANTYTGGTLLSAGILQLGNNAALGTGPFALQGGTLQATTASLTLPNPVLLNADTTISGTQPLTLTGTVTLNGFKSLNVTSTAPTTLSGMIGESSPSILIKQGAGTLHLTGANSYTGGTFISTGTVRINNSNGSAFGTGAVTVAPGATLAGAGSFTGALQLNGTFSPGNSPGITTTGSETWAGGANLIWEIASVAPGGAGTNWDLLSISGGLAINATSGSRFIINLTSFANATTAGLVPDFNPASNYSFTFVTLTSGTITGFSVDKFALNTAGTFQNPFTGTWSIASSGSDLTLNYTGASAIPEPSTYALWAGVVILGAAVLRKKRLAAP